MENYKTFVEKHCKSCENKETDLCEIHRNIKGNLQCPEETKEE